jgi:hypothetical protein
MQSQNNIKRLQDFQYAVWPTWAMARPGSGQSVVIFAGPAQERFRFGGEMKAFMQLARPAFLLQLRHWL